MKSAVMARGLEECISQIVFIKVAVPFSGSIRFGEMPWYSGKILRGKRVELALDMTPSGVGMCVDGGSLSLETINFAEGSSLEWMEGMIITK